MRPSELRLRPELSTPSLKLDELLEYPELQRRINRQQFDVSGVHNLIVELKKESIQELKEEFISNNNSVNLQQFVWLISNTLQVGIGAKGSLNSLENQYYQYEIQYELVRAFEEIDIDGSNSISWEEYIEYITSSTLIGIATSDPEDQPLTAHHPLAKELSFSHREKTTFRKNSIRKIVELEKHKMLAVLESKSDMLSFINIDGSILSKQPPLQGVDYGKVLSMDYSEEQRMFGILMNTHRVYFIEDGEMQKCHGQNKFSGDQIDIMYLRKHQLWLLRSLNHVIQIFKPPRGRVEHSNPQKVMFMFKPHEHSLVGLKQIHNPLSICTASFQGQLKLWSLSLNQLLIQINPCRQQDFIKCKAIKGFQVYNKNTTTFILCWMFSSEISVWLPSSSLSKPYLGKLKGHIGIIEEAKFLHSTPLAISIDNKHSVRVWDVSKLQCLQTWRQESSPYLRIQALQSSPYVLFYQKTIQFYWVAREQEVMQNANKAKGSKVKILPNVTPPVVQKHEKPNKRISIIQDIPIENKHNRVTFKKKVTNLEVNSGDEQQNVLDASDYVVSDSSGSEEEEENYPTRILEVLYDDYFDCLIVMQEDGVRLVQVNSGEVLNEIKPNLNTGEKFVSMSLREHRRLFVANNHGEIGFFRLEDCSELFKLKPYIQVNLMKGGECDMGKSMKSMKSMKYSIMPNDGFESATNLRRRSQYEILAVDFNTYNNVLLIIGESDHYSLMTTYDNFSSLEPSKKKEVIFEQSHLCYFVSSQKYNLFYVGSNLPELISIWDYHNFNVLKIIEMKCPIRGLSVENNRYNLLIINSTNEVRVLRINPIDAKNNIRMSQNADLLRNLIREQTVLRSNQPIRHSYFIYMENRETQMKSRRNKVRFEEDQPKDNPFNSSSAIKYGLYVAMGDTINLIRANYFLDPNDTTPEPIHSSTPNIGKQTKIATVSKQKNDGKTLNFSMNELICESVTSLNQHIDVMGPVKEWIFYSTEGNILSLYSPFDCKIKAKLTLPQLSILEWNILIPLVNKILTRMFKAESTSREIYHYKKNLAQNSEELTYLRMAFLLKKYFAPEDMDKLNSYFQQTHKITPQVKKKSTTKIVLPLESHYRETDKQYASVDNQGNKVTNSPKNYFNQRYEQRNRIRSQANQKMQELQKKYSRAFSYIKGKSTPEPALDADLRKRRSASKTDLINKKTGGSSCFKIRNKVSSANKLYVEQSKEIKQCLKKIGILNKVAQLKL